MPTKHIQRGITRYDRDETLSNGYLIRVTRDGVTHGKYFSDSKYKGKRKALIAAKKAYEQLVNCLLYTSPSPRDQRGSRMPSSA